MLLKTRELQRGDIARPTYIDPQPARFHTFIVMKVDDKGVELHRPYINLCENEKTELGFESLWFRLEDSAEWEVYRYAH